MPTSQAKNWCFTLNNYGDGDFDAIFTTAQEETSHVLYVIIGKEVGESGTPHLQGYISFSKRKTIGRVKAIVGNRAHVESARGKPAQAADYCKKEGTWKEWGELPKGQGNRSDLQVVYSQIKDGVGLREIADEFPGTVIRYHTGIKRIQQLFRPKRESPPQIWVLWGKTGSGKTKRVWEFADGDKLWIHPGEKWFDGYDGQPAVLFDDFDGSWFKLGYLLRLTDRYPMTVPVKGGHAWWAPKTIYFTSNLKPQDWYPKGNDEHRRALMRRLKEFGKIEEVIKQ